MSTVTADTDGSVPAPLRHLVDDAAIFPPGEMALPDAVRAHRSHRRSPYAALVGPFVVSDVRLTDLLEVLRAEPAEPLRVSVVVTGGAGALEPAALWAGRAGELELAGLEIALRDEDDLAHNARRVVAMLDRLLGSGDLAEDVAVHVEPPRPDAEPTTSWLAALDEIAAADHGLKLRTGGVVAEAFPSATELATAIGAALDRELRFKCTAGLHHALRHHDPATGFAHHGFLNVLLATRASLDGASPVDVAAVLKEPDREALLAQVGSTGPEALVAARRWFTSFGSCSVAEPLADLVDLGLLPSHLQEDMHG